MPTYMYECPEHGEFDAYSPVDEMKDAKVCTKCKALSPYKFKPYKVKVDIFEPYTDTNLDINPIRVESRAQKKQLLAERGLVQV